MRFVPSYLVMAALVQAALLAAFVHLAPVPDVTPREVAGHEGQGTVRLSGTVTSARPSGDSTRLDVDGDGHRVEVLVRAALHVPLGSWVEATGRVARLSGNLVLIAQGPDVVVSVPASPLRPSWQDLGAAPEAWQGVPIALAGKVASGHLGHDGHRILLGDGDWPREGAVEAVGTITYDAACLCHRFFAAQVTPAAWTP